MVNHFHARCFLRRQAALGLMELMLAIAVISILLLIGTRYFASVKYQQQVTKAATMVKDIIGAANSWGTGNPDFSNISMANLMNVNLLPNSYSKNPWGGTVSVGPKAGDPYSISISFTQVPTGACNTLKAQFPEYSIGC